MRKVWKLIPKVTTKVWKLIPKVARKYSLERKLEEGNIGARLESCYKYSIAKQKVLSSSINPCSNYFYFHISDHTVIYER